MGAPQHHGVFFLTAFHKLRACLLVASRLLLLVWGLLSAISCDCGCITQAAASQAAESRQEVIVDDETVVEQEKRCWCLRTFSDELPQWDLRLQTFMLLRLEEAGSHDATSEWQHRENSIHYGSLCEAGQKVFLSKIPQGWKIGTSQDSSDADGFAYTADNADHPEETRDWRVYLEHDSDETWSTDIHSDEGGGTWEFDESFRVLCVPERDCIRLAHEEKQMAKTQDPCIDDYTKNDFGGRERCLRRVLARTSADNLRQQAFLRSQLGYHIRRQHNPDLKNNAQRMEESVVLQREALQRGPMIRDIVAQYGDTLLLVDRLDEAVHALKPLLSSGSAEPADLENLIRAFQWLGRDEEADEVKRLAVELKVFPSIHHRPVEFYPRVIRRPVWASADITGSPTNSVTFYKAYPCLERTVAILQERFPEIRKEYIEWNAAMPEGSKDTHADRFSFADPALGAEAGWWEYFIWPLDPFKANAEGKEFERSDRAEACQPRTPVTCATIKELGLNLNADLIMNLASRDDPRILNARFSVIGPKAHLRSHVGPTNSKLSLHMPLTMSRARIRVVDDIYELVEGFPFIFDDTFEHEVWNDGDIARATLWLFISHPEVGVCGDPTYKSGKSRKQTPARGTRAHPRQKHRKQRGREPKSKHGKGSGQQSRKQTSAEL